MHKFIFLIASFLLAQTQLGASNKAMADSAYILGNYTQAVALYDSLLSLGHNATLYHNQGNAYYRLEEYPKAILAYERGLRYAPTDVELAHNLTLANSKLPDLQRTLPPFFVVAWYRHILLWFTVSHWAMVASTSLIVALALLLLYRLAHRLMWRKIGFWLACAALVISLWSTWATFALHSYLEDHTTAIVMQQTPISDSPSTDATASKYVSAGTKVKVIDHSLKDYWRVTLPNGQSVWVPNRNLETI